MSVVWEYFTVLEEYSRFAQCKTCQAPIEVVRCAKTSTHRISAAAIVTAARRSGNRGRGEKTESRGLMH